MDITKLPLFETMRERLSFLTARQSVLAENVANAETPGYRGKDLKAFAFEDHMRNLSVAQITTTATQPSHFSVAGIDSDGFGPRKMNSFEVTPEGNGVTLEDEMMKVTSNQMDYQAVTTLYTRSMRILRVALGKNV